MNYRGQGSIEYLLILSAAVVVVAIVISFMIGTIKPVTSSSDEQTLRYTCVTLNTNSLTCGCYLCDPTKGGYNDVTKTNSSAVSAICNAYSSAKTAPLLMWTGRCG